MTALTRNSSANFRYWVAFRARHSTADDALLDLTGKTEIRLARRPNEIFFIPRLPNTFPRARVAWTDYRDIGGFHADPAPAGTKLFKNYDTQVISSTDNGLENGTSEAIRRYFNEPTTVGVDASLPNQQLLFLLKAPSGANIFERGVNGISSNYHTRIYYNPNVFQTVSNKGL